LLGTYWWKFYEFYTLVVCKQNWINLSRQIQRLHSRYFLITESSQERSDHESDGELGQGEGRGDGSHDTQAMVALDNKHNLAQREQYYAAVQKGIATHKVERVPGEFS
jgi:hypothetical protein